MAGLIYSFAQLEAFTAVAENGSLSKAAVALKKDRTTLRDLVDFLEDGLGYALFIRDGRTLRLGVTPGFTQKDEQTPGSGGGVSGFGSTQAPDEE